MTLIDDEFLAVWIWSLTPAKACAAEIRSAHVSISTSEYDWCVVHWVGELILIFWLFSNTSGRAVRYSERRYRSKRIISISRVVISFINSMEDCKLRWKRNCLLQTHSTMFQYQTKKIMRVEKFSVNLKYQRVSLN